MFITSYPVFEFSPATSASGYQMCQLHRIAPSLTAITALPGPAILKLIRPSASVTPDIRPGALCQTTAALVPAMAESYEVSEEGASSPSVVAPLPRTVASKL